ncbi:MAG TPA: homospermidine synthase [Verrucomicrobia bacterium]|nr:MAG: homospermidine synthase [Lentisphaerae bacterium GWF2_57_35]HBA82936.1 homospermidine synthase [Verrucomicrobiota bacterium]
MREFSNNVLMVGYGAVAQCTLPVLTKLIDIPCKNITVMDFEDRTTALAPWLERGVKFVRERITQGHLGVQLGKYLKMGDLLIDLAWNIDACEILQWCHSHGVLYINTSVEIWDPYAHAEKKHPTERTLYWRHMNIRRMTAGWKEKGPTAVMEHGANPGLISHWTRKGLVDIGERLIADKKVSGHLAEEIRHLIDKRIFNQLAMRMGVKVIHVSERDTQVTNQPKQIDEFVNTWSIEGFREEGVTTAEMGWGTHEKALPALAYEHHDGPKNQICLARMGMNTWVRTWAPHYTIQGMVIRHGEAFTLSDRLTVWEGEKAVYRPTVHYAYCPCDSAIASLHELRGKDYELQPKLRIMSDEITQGADILGALLMGHPYNSWWTGSNLSIEESRRLIPHQNATTLQVAISVVAAAIWMIENPAMGVCSPEDLPYDYILGLANPYLGESISIPSDWTPLKHHQNFFKGFNHPAMDPDSMWQFKNFLVSELG